MTRMDPARLSARDREGTALKAALLELKREVPCDADLETLRGEILQRLGFEHSDSGVRLLPAALRTRAMDLDGVARSRNDERRAPIAASGEGRRARAPRHRLRAHHCTVLVGAVLAAAAVALLIMTGNEGSLEAPPTTRHSDGEESQSGDHGVAASPQDIAPPVVAPVSTRAGSEGALVSRHADGVREEGRRIATTRRRAVGSSGERRASTQASRVEASNAPDQPAQRAATAHLAGVININSIPFTRVVLDGRVLGGTPLVGVTVSPGEHTVLFVDFDGERRLKKVNVDPGRTVLAAVRFD